MSISFDHLVVAARSLGEGVAWVEDRLGVAMGPGGKHGAMSTHNRLLSLGPGRFLEVIAIDPEAPPPGRPRWFELDTEETRQRLAHGPALVHWVARTDDLLSAIGAVPGARPEVLELTRGEFRWSIGVPPSGRLALGGVAPTMIRWQGLHPSERLPDAGCRLERLLLRHREAPALLRALAAAGLDPGTPLEVEERGLGLLASLRTPRGIVEVA
jgi:hypothetical protein